MWGGRTQPWEGSQALRHQHREQEACVIPFQSIKSDILGWQPSLQNFTVAIYYLSPGGNARASFQLCARRGRKGGYSSMGWNGKKENAEKSSPWSPGKCRTFNSQHNHARHRYTHVSLEVSIPVTRAGPFPFHSLFFRQVSAVWVMTPHTQGSHCLGLETELRTKRTCPDAR